MNCPKTTFTLPSVGMDGNCGAGKEVGGGVPLSEESSCTFISGSFSFSPAIVASEHGCSLPIDVAYYFLLSCYAYIVLQYV